MSTEVPEGWKWTRIGEQFSRVTRKNTAGITRVLTASGEHGLIDQEEYFNKRVAARSVAKYYHLKRGEFAYNRSSMRGYPCGAIKRLDRYEAGVLSTLYLCFRLRDGATLASDYAVHLFASGILDRELLPIVRVGARAHGLLNVTPSEFMEVSLRLPPLPEQRRIAGILSAVDSSIDAACAVIDQTRRTRAGLLQDLLSQGALSAGPAGRTVQMAQGAPGSKYWPLVPLGSVATKIVDGVHKTPVYVDDGVPFITVKNLTAGDRIDFADTKFITPGDDREFSRRTDPRTGDILVSKDGTLGVARLVEDDMPRFNIFVSVALIRADQTQVLPGYIKAFFDSQLFTDQLAALSAGSGLKHIHLSHFRQFRLPLPPLAEQERIVNSLRLLDGTLRAQVSKLERFRAIKAGLLQDLLTGKVRVTV